MGRPFRSALCGLILTALSTGSCLAAENWPQFRGPTGQGISDSTGLPATWGEKENVVWKTAIHGKSHSSPVVWGSQVWVTTATENGRELSALCVDKDSGKVLFDLKLFEVPTPQYAHPFNSYSSPTPAIEEGKVYVTFGSPGTACLDTKTGRIVWERRDFVCNHWRGAGSSPVVWNDLLFLPFDGADYQYIVALDKNTGKTAWKVDRGIDYKDLDASGKPEAGGDWRKAFSTPRLVTFADGKPVLLSLGSKAIYGYEPTTGDELWRVENRELHSGSATPVVGKDLIYINMGHGPRPELWAIRPGGSGVVNDTHVAWKYRGNVPTRSSVLLWEGLIYMVDDGGIASCVDAKTGKKVWSKRIGGEYSASPLYADGRIYFFSQDGKTTAIAPGREMKVVGEAKLDEGFMGSAAVSGKALILRTKTHLYRVEAK